MDTQDTRLSWEAFQATNRRRRAIRHFSPTPVPEADLYALLAEATLAPSSGNLQPYTLHWVRDPALKQAIAKACNGQRAAAAAPDLIVIAASAALGRQTARMQLAHVATAPTLGPDARAYHRRQIGMFQKILGIGAWALWTPLLSLAALARPALSLLPVGHLGSRQWAARNALLAAQTLMLAAAAKGIDSCPMEGFSAPTVARLLDMPRGTVIPLIIALGYRADNARIETQWRRPMTDVVILHTPAPHEPTTTGTPQPPEAPAHGMSS